MQCRHLISIRFLVIAVAFGFSVSVAMGPRSSLAAVEPSGAAAERAEAVSGPEAPVLTPPSNMTLGVEQTADQTLYATDANGDPLSFSKASGPGYMTVSTTDPGTGTATGNVHLAPGPSDAGTVAADVSVSDGLLAAQRSFLIDVVGPNVAPVLTQPEDMTVTQGTSQAQDLLATDANGDLLSFYLVSGPAYATVTTPNPGPGAAEGEIVLSPGHGSSGTDIAIVGVSDGSLTDQKSFTIKVTPGFQHRWSHGFGGANDLPSAVAVDAAGNVALTGSLHGPADFGGGPLAVAGGGDLFLAKFDTAGNHVWSKPFGDGSIQNGLDVAFDRDGNIVVTGYLFGSADFGGGPRVSAGADDILLVKLDPNGNHIWSKNFGGANSFPNFQRGESVVIDDLGNIFLAGSLGGTVEFGGAPVGGSIFLARFDAAGEHLWSRGFGGSLYEPRLAVDAGGNVLMTAKFAGSADFGGGVLTSAGYDVLLAKFAPDGTHMLSRLFGDSGQQEPLDVATDPSGNILLTGIFAGSINFGGSPVASAGSDDIFFAKLGPSGNHLWSQSFRGSGSLYATELGLTMGVGPGGDVVLAGTFDGTINFGGGSLVESGTGDIFLAEFDPSGAHRVSQKFGNSQFQWNSGSAVDSHGGIVIMGGFNFSIDFGGGPLTSSDFRAMYLTKFAGKAPLVATAAIEPHVVNLRSHGLWMTVYLELAGFDPASIDVSSVRLAGSVPAEGKSVSVGDYDRDGIPELKMKFSRQALGPLLRLGVNELEVTGSLVSGEAFTGKDEVRVIEPGGGGLSASVKPNPLNPAGVLTYTTTSAGKVAVRMFDLRGRLVRTLVDVPLMPGGEHEVMIDGRGERGQTLASGVYFYRVETGEGIVTGRVAILK